jgi:hypothetical protein
VAKVLRRTDDRSDASTEVLRSYLAAVIGNSGTSDTAAIGLLADILASSGSNSVDSAETALARLGAKAAPILESRWDRSEDYVKIRIARVMGAMPRDARTQEWMRRRRAKTSVPSVQRAMDEVLDP